MALGGHVGGGVGVGTLRSSTCLAMDVDRIGVTQLICISFWTNDTDKGAVAREGDCSSLPLILTRPCCMTCCTHLLMTNLGLAAKGNHARPGAAYEFAQMST